MNLAQISNYWVMWNKFVKWAKQYPDNPAFQRSAQVAQMHLVCHQALYWNKVKP